MNSRGTEWKAERPCPWKKDETVSFKVSPNQNQLGFNGTGKDGRGLKKHVFKLFLTNISENPTYPTENLPVMFLIPAFTPHQTFSVPQYIKH